MEPTSGLCGLGSIRRPMMAPRRFATVRAGLHIDSKESKHIFPVELMLQWYMRVRNVILGGEKG